MVSEVEEKILAQLALIQARLDRIERNMLPSVEVSARERALLRRRLNGRPEDWIPWEQVKAELEAKRR